MSCGGGGGGAARSAMTLNRKLVLQGAQPTPDGAGGCDVTWTTLGTLWARVVPRSGRMNTGESGAVSASGFDVWVRGAPVGHSARPLPGQRLVMGARVLRIEAVTEEEPRGMYLRCACSEEVAV